MQAEIEVLAADGLAHQRAGAVAADDVTRVEVVDRGDLVAEMDAHVGEALQALAQHAFEDRLMEVPVAGPAVRARPVDAAADHQGAALAVDEVHAPRRGAHHGGDLLGEPGALEDAHDLAVEMHGARQRMDLALAVVDVDREPGLAQQVR